MFHQTIGLPIGTLIFIVIGASLVAAPFEITRSTVDGGGAMESAGGTFELSGTIGQPDAGLMTGGQFELFGGFWFPVERGDCNEDGAANLLDHAAFESCLVGPEAVTPVGCECFDLDGNGMIDLRDIAAGQLNFQDS